MEKSLFTDFEPIIIMIYAPGNCDKIPRKYSRLLLNKPLLQYSIETFKEITHPSLIVVLSDDEEIILIADRLNVLFENTHENTLAGQQPRFYFGDPITLNILHKCEEKLGLSSKYVIWHIPSSPLLHKRDVFQAIWELSRSPKDAIFSASVAPQRQWHYDTKRAYQPFFEETPSIKGVMHLETSCFFIMKRSAINKEGYQGTSSMPYFLPEDHAIEINTFHDWWVVEKLIERKHILFVVAGSTEIGMGHIYRALALAQEFSDHKISFLCIRDSELAALKIAEFYYPTRQQANNTSLLDDVLNFSPDIVINDFLNTDEAYMMGLKKEKIMVINFEDIGAGAKHADLVINALYNQKLYPHMLVGHDYFCLRNEFYTANKSVFRDQVLEILVTFGGTDENAQTLRILKILLKLKRKYGFHITVITGPGYLHTKDTEPILTENKDHNIEWIRHGTKKISEFMSKADFALTSAGRTVYELAALGVPAIVLATNEREEKHPFAKESSMFYLGRCDLVADKVIEKNIKIMLDSPQVRLSIRASLVRYDLINGKKKVIDEIQKCIKGLTCQRYN